MSPEMLTLAHGVGRVYQAPLPLALYLVGAATTVVVSFVLRALVTDTRPLRPEKKVAGETFAIVAARFLRGVGVVFLTVTVAAGVFGTDQSLGLAALLFWIGLVVGTVVTSAGVAGTWERSDPWTPLLGAIRSEPRFDRERTGPRQWWIAPLGLFALFWFELVSGVGFDSFWIVVALLAYSLLALSLRPAIGEAWPLVDPLTVLFHFSARIAPLRLGDRGLYYKGTLASLDEQHPMPAALFASLFVLLGSTTLDNVRETVGWTELRDSLGLGAANNMLVDTVALVLFGALFFASFLITLWIASRFVAEEGSLVHLARRFGWSLIPIGVAYLIAHNAPLLVSGVPQIIRSLSDPFERGWNLFGTAGAFIDFLPSPAVVWFFEIALIVGGHILAVLAAHRTAIRLGRSRRAAVRSQYALTALMSLFTIATLWLLSQPLVA